MLIVLVGAWLLLGVIGHVLSFLFSTVLLVARGRRGDLGAPRTAVARDAVAYVVIAVCFGLAGGIVGKIKGSSFFLWFLISGLVPFFGLLAAIAYRFEQRRAAPPVPAVRARDEDLRRDLHALRRGARLPRRGRRSRNRGSAHRPRRAERHSGSLSRIRPA